MKKIPFKLDLGIYFEDSDEILKWNTEIEKLKIIDNPVVRVSETTTVLHWKNKKCFGGMELNVLIEMDELRNKNGKFNHIRFGQMIDPMDTYQKTYLF